MFLVNVKYLCFYKNKSMGTNNVLNVIPYPLLRLTGHIDSDIICYKIIKK